MTRDLSRLLRPRSVAVIGGGAWCRQVTHQLLKAGFDGEIWPVHPRATEIEGLRAYAGVPDLPAAPDAAFVGINREATIGAVERLARRGAGGAVCFASGFAEASDGAEANARLLRAAGDMPILGPNCYGYVNALDGALLWPDQHGCVPVDRGVAILTQSSNIAINLTMQARGLPIGVLVACGNQAQTSQAEIAHALLDDPRITAIGVHVEGFGDLAAWQAFARRAADRGVPVVALKVGTSEAARAATISHTASLAGSATAAEALLRRFGFARVDDLPTFLETLKLLHLCGPLPSADLATISCSGGEASLSADLGAQLGVSFPTLTAKQTAALGAALGPQVALANPLDYHTHIWRDVPAMTAAFSAMVADHLAMTILVVDIPREDRCDPADWDCVIEAAAATRAATGARIGMAATLPELMPEHVASRLTAAGVVPFAGLREALAASVAAASARPGPDLWLDLPPAPQAPPPPAPDPTEAEAKDLLSAHGLPCPGHRVTDDPVAAAADLAGPVALKAIGLAHKSDAGGVALGLADAGAVAEAAARVPGPPWLVERMVEGGVAELLVGITRDPAHGLMLTVGAGGVLAEIWEDSASAIVPASHETLAGLLDRLRMAPMLDGFRGRPAADRAAIVAALEALQEVALAHADRLGEIEVNPLICTPTGAIAADALIRWRR